MNLNSTLDVPKGIDVLSVVSVPWHGIANNYITIRCGVDSLAEFAVSSICLISDSYHATK
jgi:hypothetical protein